MGDGTEPSATGLTNLLRLLGTAFCMSGEATSRVAAHLDDVAKAYGVSGVRVFVLPTGVFVRITQHGVTAIDFAPASGGHATAGPDQRGLRPARQRQGQRRPGPARPGGGGQADRGDLRGAISVAALLVTVVAVVLAAQTHVAEANRLIIPALVTLLPGTALTIGSARPA